MALESCESMYFVPLVGTFINEKALEGAFSGHCEISRSPIDSSKINYLSFHFNFTQFTF